MIGLETSIEAQRNATVLTIAHSLSSFVMLAADNTPLFLVDISFCWMYSSRKVAFRQPLDDDLTIMVI
jgi:hypothetical protein